LHGTFTLRSTEEEEEMKSKVDLIKQVYAEKLAELIPDGVKLVSMVKFRNSSMTLDDWMSVTDITERDREQFPNAKAAQRIKDSKLYKVMK